MEILKCVCHEMAVSRWIQLLIITCQMIKSPLISVYDRSVSPDCTNVFGAAAFRYAHSQLQTDVFFTDNKFQDSDDEKLSKVVSVLIRSRRKNNSYYNTHTHIYIYIYVCVCVYVYMYRQSWIILIAISLAGSNLPIYDGVQPFVKELIEF